MRYKVAMSAAVLILESHRMVSAAVLSDSADLLRFIEANRMTLLSDQPFSA